MVLDLVTNDQVRHLKFLGKLLDVFFPHARKCRSAPDGSFRVNPFQLEDLLGAVKPHLEDIKESALAEKGHDAWCVAEPGIERKFDAAYIHRDLSEKSRDVS